MSSEAGDISVDEIAALKIASSIVEIAFWFVWVGNVMGLPVKSRKMSKPDEIAITGEEEVL